MSRSSTSSAASSASYLRTEAGARLGVTRACRFTPPSSANPASPDAPLCDHAPSSVACTVQLDINLRHTLQQLRALA